MPHAEQWQRAQRTMQVKLASEIGARVEEINTTAAAFARKLEHKRKARERRRGTGTHPRPHPHELPQARASVEGVRAEWRFERRVLWHLCRRDGEREVGVEGEQADEEYNEARLQRFHERWRSFFLSEMHARHMPEGFEIATPIG